MSDTLPWQVLVDDTDPRIQYQPGINWTFTRIDASDLLSYPGIGQVTPMYGTLHFLDDVNTSSAPMNMTLSFDYNGTDFSAHFKSPGALDTREPLCLLDKNPQVVQTINGVFICSSTGDIKEGNHQLVITFTDPHAYAFDYLLYNQSKLPTLQDELDVMFGTTNETIFELTGQGSSASFLFEGYSAGLYALFSEVNPPSAVSYDMEYGVDDLPTVSFTFSQPINATNPFGEPQLVLQTPRLGPGAHNLTLKILPTSAGNAPIMKIQSYVVQNSGSSIDLELSAIPTFSPSVTAGRKGGKRVGVIVGSTIGALVFCILAVVIAISLLRRRRRKLTRLSRTGVYIMNRLGPNRAPEPEGIQN